MKATRPLIVLLSFTLAGCLPAMNASPADGATSGATVDDSQVLARVAGGAYRNSAAFLPVSGAPYPSTAAAQTNVNVWVSAPDYATYTRISPDATGSGASLLPGAMIVREVLAADGSVAKVTLMMKGPPGYNPTVGDFWFGVTGPDGTPVADNGALQMGRVSACFGCHMTRASDGYLFGVSPADRRAPGSTPPPSGGGADGGVAPADMGATGCDGDRHGHGGCGDNDQ